MKETVWERLEKGEYIDIDHPNIDEYLATTRKCLLATMRYNTEPMSSDDARKVLSEIVGYEVDPMTNVIPPFNCDLGFNIILGKNVLINYKCTFLDTAKITVGDNVLIGPGTQIVTAMHPMEPADRRKLAVRGEPVTIEDDVWICAGVTVLPGITIGHGSIVGAGSVVTHDVPPNTTVVGNPARPIKR